MFLLGTALQAADASRKHILETEHYLVEITVRCPEGDVSCERVGYRGVNKKTGAALELRGETMHSTCADGVTPCRFLGYRFRNGKTHYFVWEEGDGEKGTLEVRTDRQVLLTERGTWK
ncbi:MAG: hypothetical protein J5X21_16570 [Candidatus Accumulibacter sp.]|nr:hypothetical protein [Accumulibacter sp.]MBO3707987.1 hypothetical protein [Candidatus Accumulibacter conexus]